MIRKRLQNAYSDLARRISLALAPFTMTLLGAAFGMSISRVPSRKAVILVTLMVAFFLVSFFMGKAKDEYFYIATALYTVPHLLIIAASVLVLRKASRGIECLL